MTEVTSALAEQRFRSHHFPETWTEEAEFERQLWVWHDGHKHENHFAVCVTCMTLMEEWQNDEIAKKSALYNYAKELEQEIYRLRVAEGVEA